MRISQLCTTCVAVVLYGNVVDAFFVPPVLVNQRHGKAASLTRTEPLNLWLPDDHTFASASSFIATIDSDIASIPDDQFGKVFAGGIFIMFGSVLSTIFVGFLIESGGGGYADLVAETYAEQNMGEEEESYLNSLGLNAGQKAETEEMVRSFREKKMKKAGTWTIADEEQKQQLMVEKKMFDDYD